MEIPKVDEYLILRWMQGLNLASNAPGLMRLPGN
jgi:hypothetical protein